MSGSTYDHTSRRLSVCRYTGVRVKPVSAPAQAEWYPGTVSMGLGKVFDVCFTRTSDQLWAKPRGLHRSAEFDTFFAFRSARDFDPERVVQVVISS